MNNTKEVLHTQGTWEVFQYRENGETSQTRIVSYDKYICEINHYAFGAPSQEEIKANAELICKAVNERQKLLDSHKELLRIVKNMELWHELENGVFKWTSDDGDQLVIDLQTAINNAKNIQ